MSTTLSRLNEIRQAISLSRISTYENQVGAASPDDPRAVALYAWNAQISSAFFVPLHICEVTIRNAVSEVLESTHGARWPWKPGFVASIPSVPLGKGYSPRWDLTSVARTQPTTGRVIAELKFAFWEQMFTKRHDNRLWNAHLKRLFPEHPPTMTVRDLRKRIYHDLEEIRKLRNRIAHHEPIFQRALGQDFDRIRELIRMRSPLVESWMIANQQVTALILAPAVFRGGMMWFPSHAEIEVHAYQLWIDGGRQDYSAQSDWFAARRALGIA